jgi:hypothetical protein
MAKSVKTRRREFWLRLGWPYADAEKRTCAADVMRKWTMMHFPCSGTVEEKAGFMGALLRGFRNGTARVIKSARVNDEV